MTRILVIDDDASVRFAAQAILELEGYEVAVAPSGRDGLEKIAITPFDAVIVDVFMPGMDGLQTIKAFNQQAPHVPIIAMSGYVFRASSAPAPDFLSMATGLGATSTLRKPFRVLDLLKAIDACHKKEHLIEA